MHTRTMDEILTPAQADGSCRLEVCPACGSGKIVPLLQAPDRFHGRTQLYQLVRCPACALVWLHDPPLSQEMGQHYGPDYDRAIALAGESPDRWTERTKVLRHHKQGGAILDLGCSSGAFLQTLEGKGWDLYGIEMSADYAQRALDRCGANVFVGDILDAPFLPASFDAITCFHVFEHLYQPRQVLQRVAEWLKPGGIFYLMVPNIDSAGAHIFKSYWYALELPRHLYFFSPASLRNLAHSVGLEEVTVTTHREVFIENSSRYILDEWCRKAGYSRPPLAKAGNASLPWKVVRKLFRMIVLPVLNGLASVAGDGESIHAMFRKPL